MLRRIFRTIVVPFAVGLLLAGCGEIQDHEAEAAASDAARVGPAADFTLKDMDGKEVSLSDYKGQVVLLNFWATWCGPCKKEMPSMEQAYQAYKDRGFRIAAVSLDEGESAPVRAFAEGLGLTFDILQDRSNLSQQVYQAIGVPHSVLIGRDGRVAWVALGAEDWHSAAYQKRIEALLGEDE